MSQSPLSAFVAAVVISVAGVASAANLPINSGFSQQAQLSGWSGTAASWSSDDSNGSADSGSALFLINDLESMAITQCVPIDGNLVYDFGVDVKLATQAQAAGKAGIVVRSFLDPGCENELTNFPVSAYALTDFANDWTNVHGQFTSRPDAVSARIEVRATKTQGSQGATLTANLDDALLQVSDAEPACGDPQVPYGTVTTGDALFVLRASVGSVECDDCLCDMNDSGDTTSGDALAVLRLAVGSNVSPDCPPCS